MIQKDLLELIVGTLLYIFVLVACVFIINRITRSFNPDGALNVNILLLCVHLFLIVAFVFLIRFLFFQSIKNNAGLNRTFTITAAVTALLSLYMSDTLLVLVHKI